jgi:hypothetical protein
MLRMLREQDLEVGCCPPMESFHHVAKSLEAMPSLLAPLPKQDIVQQATSNGFKNKLLMQIFNIQEFLKALL